MTNIQKNEPTVGGMMFPVLERTTPTPGNAAFQKLTGVESSVTDTVIVLAALFAVIMVGLLLGRSPGTNSLHPVWQIILGLAGLGVLGAGARLLRLVKQSGPSSR